ncbi:FkbM family methyltransferase [Streptomonospora litoralis]|uniref:Methyltransferase domain protein n=1 Tax=Streptomonospora litoralis TaxID=2498135 RepID=A0A4P6PYT9_9ACTN|nr:FkbM family methyltransferase [Streptomonospora litoralis]QBI53408.1 Methyltransferase domain protein [Streptomonospora litoralis]
MKTRVLDISVPEHEYRITDPGGRIGRQLAAGKPYEHRLLAGIRKRRLAGSALDIGAHVGNHSLYLAIVCELRVHAFEAHPARVRALRTNLGLNDLGDDRVRIYPMAAGAGSAEAHWREDEQRMTLEVGRGNVEVRAVDELLDLDDLVLVKLDVEGMEPAALVGMRRHLARCHPLVVTETHTRAAHDAQAAVLEPLGYEMGKPVKMGSRMEVWEWSG